MTVGYGLTGTKILMAIHSVASSTPSIHFSSLSPSSAIVIVPPTPCVWVRDGLTDSSDVVK